MSKFVIDLGHGVGNDRGAVGYLQEENVINAVGSIVIDKLRAMGHEVITSRPSSAQSVSMSLSSRVATSNANHPDLFVSIHANAGGGTGTEIYTYNGSQYSQANNVLNNLCSLGFQNRGVKPSNSIAYVVNHTNARAMLIELFFIDNKSDVERYINIGANKLADAIVKGLTGSTVAINQSKPVTKPTNLAGKISELQSLCNKILKTNLVIDNLWGPKTEAAVKRLPLCGYPYVQRDLTRWVQLRLGCTADGIFGINTKNEVIKWQRNHGLTQDGIVGFNTYRSLALS